MGGIKKGLRKGRRRPGIKGARRGKEEDRGKRGEKREGGGDG